jgi:plasmid stabilization system protein ParE
MRRQVTTTADALEALREARLWLTQPGSGLNARKRWADLRDVGRRLRRNAYLGHPVAEFAGHRQLVVSGYRVIYQVLPDTGENATAGDIRIVAIFGPGQLGRD